MASGTKIRTLTRLLDTQHAPLWAIGPSGKLVYLSAGVGEWLRVYILWWRDAGDLGVVLAREARRDPRLQQQRREGENVAARGFASGVRERSAVP